MSDYLILGSGLAGLSCSYHIGHDRCLILEKNAHAYGHIHSEIREGFTWDQGPHVSFTKHEYVRSLFAKNVADEFIEQEVKTANYFHGSWVDHPAQSNLYQVPEPLRSSCLDSFLSSRGTPATEPADYGEWLVSAFGKVFAENFPSAYTRKYWTVDPAQMTTDWVGKRVFKPDVNEVRDGAKGNLGRPTHYIQSIRYPKTGGYQSFARTMRSGANILFGVDVSRIDLRNKKLWVSDGREFTWNKLINTIPLPKFISLCLEVPPGVVAAAREISCSSVYLVNIATEHPTMRGENWMYVYDEDKLSTRINCTEKLSPQNAPENRSGVQVEVYHSRHKPLTEDPESIRRRVVDELVEMGLIRSKENNTVHGVHCPWANVIFTHETRPALDMIWTWLEGFGLEREDEDLRPCTDWDNTSARRFGDLAMAGRFGQWKYFWTDDCVMRGKFLSY
jgi:protoporphyrinogen oxidase